jgi:penicillin-binding protein 1A
MRTAVAALSGVLAVTLAGLVAAAVGLWYYSRDLPDYQALATYEPPVVSRVYAGNGTLIGEFAAERRIFVPYAAIPARVRQAFISAEDQRFFSHPGLDLYGVARVLRDGAVHGTRLQGASTITQQVARTFFLTAERSFGRKLREAILAWRIEHAYSKEKILELYLNKIFLGRQSYGVAAAAQAYFGKALEELTLAETALLAALPQAPSRFDPTRHPGLVKARRAYVIQRMLEDGAMTEAEADEAKAAPLGVKPRRPHLDAVAEYFVEEVRREMLAKYGDDKMKAGGFVIRSTIDLRLQGMADAALRAGLVAYDRRHGWRGPLANIRSGADWIDGWRRKLRTVKTPEPLGDWQIAVVLELDPGAAEIGLRDGGHGRIPLAELTWARRQGEVKGEPGKPIFRTATGPAIRRPADVLKPGDVIFVERLRADPRGKTPAADTFALRQLPDVTGALVAMDPHTGRVLAMSGGLDFARSQFNNATQAWRQPGSSFKPYVYLAALAAGHTPTTMLLDAPVTLTNGRDTYSPKNYSGQFYGPVTMRMALEMSLNVATLRLAQATGLRRVADLAMKLGVSDKVEPILAMPLGAFETTPLRHVTAYSMIVNGGKRIEATLVDRIQDRYGRTIYRHDARECDACASVAFRRQSMPSLSDAREQALDPENAFQIVSILQGAAQRSPSVQPLGRRVAGKTGSTNESVDAWFVGFTTDLAVAVWVGFDKPRSLGKKETGSITAAPIFAQFMREAMKHVPARDFVPPKGLVAVQTAAGMEYYKRGTEPPPRPNADIDTAEGPGAVPRAWTDDQEVIESDMPAPPQQGPPRSFSYQPPEHAEPRRDDQRDLPPPSLSAPRLDAPLPPPRGPGAIYR